jgi:glycerophosphoryl diester phosphodiesterase
VALDIGVSSIETDVHLAQDNEPVLTHDPWLTTPLFRIAGASKRVPELALRPLVSSLTLAQLQAYVVQPMPDRFPRQDAEVTPLARLIAQNRGIDAFSPPSLADLCNLIIDYTGERGIRAGKTKDQRRKAQNVKLDLELKRVPFRPEYLNDGFDGHTAGRLEQRVMEVACTHGFLERLAVRSFDHRCVIAWLKQVSSLSASRLTAGLLVAGTAPLSAAAMVRKTKCQVYCPEYLFLHESQVIECHKEGFAVLPWTVNESADWQRLLEWRVDGITTDYPDRLAQWLKGRGISWS